MQADPTTEPNRRAPTAPVDRNGNPVLRLNLDGYVNAVMGFGMPGLDRTAHTRFAVGMPRSVHDLAGLYAGRGLAARIVDLPADDSLARGVTIEGDDENAIAAEFDRLGALRVLQDAVRWARLDGAAAVLLVAPGRYDEPLNPDNPGRIAELRAYSVTQLAREPGSYTDPTQPNVGEPMRYRVTPGGSDPFVVHETRLLRITGDPLPPSGAGWRVPWDGRSALEACVEDVGRYLRSLGWTERLLERKQQAIYQMLGLAELIAAGEETTAQKRVGMVDMVRSILNSVVIDKEDAYTVLNLGLDGIQPAINELQVAISAATGIPVTVLMGRSPAGQNATGTSDLEIYYGLVGNKVQARTLRRPMERLVEVLWRQPNMAREPEDWTLTFNPLWVPTAKEQAETEKTRAEARTAQVNAVVSAIDGQMITGDEGRDHLAREWPELGIEVGTPLPAISDDDREQQ